MQKDKVRNQAGAGVTQTFAMDDADDEDDEEDEDEDEDSDDGETNDDAELTEDSFRDGTVDKDAQRRPQIKVPPIGLASQNLFSQAADRGEKRAPSAHTVPPNYERGSSRSGTRGHFGSEKTAGSARGHFGSTATPMEMLGSASHR